MADSRKRSPRRVRQEPGYPPLREHMATRREVLGFLGASVATAALTACVPGKPANPNYRSFRLPESGELTTPLASGETCHFHVTGVYYSEVPEDLSAAEQACLDVMAGFTYAALATDEGHDEAEQALHDALDPLLPQLEGPYLSIV